MKFKKDEIGASLFEGIIEIILTIILCAVGFGVCFIFSEVFKTDLNELDFDSYALIGIAALIIIAIVIGKIKQSLSKKNNREQSPKQSDSST